MAKAKLTEEQKEAKLETLMEIYGFDDVQAMLEEMQFEGCVASICTEPDCDATFDWEPDCEGGQCEECGCESVDSCMILAGVI